MVGAQRHAVGIGDGPQRCARTIANLDSSCTARYAIKARLGTGSDTASTGSVPSTMSVAEAEKVTAAPEGVDA